MITIINNNTTTKLMNPSLLNILGNLLLRDSDILKIKKPNIPPQAFNITSSISKVLPIFY